MKFVLQWIDLGWLIMAYFIARKDQRAWVMGFYISSMLMMRLLTELMVSINHPNGLIGLVETPVHTRALILYSLSYVAYMLFIYFSPNAKGTLLMATSIAIFFASFFTTALVMVL